MTQRQEASERLPFLDKQARLRFFDGLEIVA